MRQIKILLFLFLLSGCSTYNRSKTDGAIVGRHKMDYGFDKQVSKDSTLLIIELFDFKTDTAIAFHKPLFSLNSYQNKTIEGHTCTAKFSKMDVPNQITIELPYLKKHPYFFRIDPKKLKNNNKVSVKIYLAEDQRIHI